MIYNFNQFKLNELKNVTIDIPNDYDDSYVISYKGDYWVLNNENFDENIDKINLKLNTKQEDLHDLLQYLREERPYILVGHIVDKQMYIDGYSDFRHSHTSMDLKKLKKEFNLQLILTYDMQYNTEKMDIDINSNERYFHGTTIKYLKSILKYGIKPTDNSNYVVEHNDHIFLTLNLEKAYKHAFNSSLQAASYPIIIEVNVPDKSKIGIDYDLALELYGINSQEVKELGFDNVYFKTNSSTYIDTKPTYKDEGFGNIINKIGVVSYKGRIPSSHIVNIWIDLNNYDKYYTEVEYNDSNIMADFESEIWSELNAVHSWSEIEPSDIIRRLSDIESYVDDDYNEEDEFEDE